MPQKGLILGANQAFFHHPFSAGRHPVHDRAGTVNNFSCGVLHSNCPKQFSDRKNLDHSTRTGLDKAGGQMAKIELFMERTGFSHLFLAGRHQVHD